MKQEEKDYPYEKLIRFLSHIRHANQPRWIKDSNIKSKTLNSQKKNMSVYLQICRVGKDFFKNIDPKSPLSIKCDGFDYTEVKNSDIKKTC